MSLKPSEFIQNRDGSIYHLNLRPENIATTIITVGDPDRVDKVTKYFDEVEFSIRKREFHTQTGTYRGKRISVVSTGIGTDNIDIVLNELDALVNIDFQTREIKDELTSLDIIRIGTSGSIQKEIPIDSFLVSEMGIGFDPLMNFYVDDNILNTDMASDFMAHINWESDQGTPYAVSCSSELAGKFQKDFYRGITVTNCGFYGPQGRVLRLPVRDNNLNDKLHSFEYEGKKITNLEMETSGIYALSKLLGHRAVSLNAIIANRATGEFSRDSSGITTKLIEQALKDIVS